MNAQYQEDARGWFEEARHNGPILAPLSLINALGKTQTDLLHLINSGVYDACNKFHQEFPGVTKARYYSLEPHEKDKIVALLRWFKQPMAIAAKTHKHKAIGAVYLLIGACFGRDSLFWEKPGISSGREDELAKFASKILNGMMFSFSIPPDTPLYERELLERWETARQEYDFVAIGRLIRPFENICHPSTMMEQAVFCLQANAPQKLSRVANNCNNPMTAWILAELLSPSIRLLITEKTQNKWFMFFGLLYGGFGEKRRRDTAAGIQTQLVKCLLKASRDIPFWKQLLTVTNEHIYRYPDMQKSLGMALTKASEAAIAMYVETLPIKPDAIDSYLPNEADGAEACIGNFVAQASRKKKRFLLEMLYAQWIIFTDSPKLLTNESHVSSLFHTNIDCAASSYLKVFSTKKHIYTLMKDSTNKLNSFKNIWHSGGVEVGKFLTKELCKMNVYYAALLDDTSRFFERPFPFRTAKSLLESKYMHHTFPYQLDELTKLASKGVKTGNV